MSDTSRARGAAASAAAPAASAAAPAAPAAAPPASAAAPALGGPAAGRTRWERWNDASLEWIAYVLLAVATVLALLRPDRAPADRLVTAGLAAATAAWIYAMYTRAPIPRTTAAVRIRIYVLGLLVLAGLLMTRSPIFFIFAISCYFHASIVRPWPLTILAVFATSVLIDVLVTGFPWPTTDLWILFGSLIVVQTVAIGFGSVIGERVRELNDERRLLLAEREASLREIRVLQEQVVAQAREAGVLDERARMAREIHDTLAHGLTGIVTQLEAAGQATDRPPDRTRHVANALGLARESLAEARRSLEGSRPGALERASLEEAVRDVAGSWSGLHGIPAPVTVTGTVVPLHPDVEAAVLRTVQEALANVAKHAHATRAGVTLSYMDDVVTIDVRDDGVGFDVASTDRPQPAGASEPGARFGLSAMRQRVGRLAGTLSIESERGGGTAVSASLPAIAPSPGTEP